VGCHATNTAPGLKSRSTGAISAGHRASEKHDVLIEDEAGAELSAGSFAHDEAGLRSLCRTPVRFEVGLVAIERPDGLLVGRMSDAGLRLLALHANQVAAARARFRVSGGKSDRVDSLCAVRAGAHPRSSLPGARGRRRSDQGRCGRYARTRESGPEQGRARQPAARQAGALLAGADRPL